MNYTAHELRKGVSEYISPSIYYVVWKRINEGRSGLVVTIFSATWSFEPDKNGVLRMIKVLSIGIVSIRTVEKLIPLEISSAVQKEDIVERPKRKAAIQARNRWQNQDNGI